MPPGPGPGMDTGFNPYAAGSRRYGSGRSMPNIGPVSGSGLLGYSQRDNQAKARKDAIVRRLKAQQSGNTMNPVILNSGYKGVA